MPEIRISRISYFLSIVTIFEIFKILNKEPILEAIFKIIFFFSLTITFYKMLNMISLIIISYEILESISWLFTHSGFNVQVLLAIDLDWCYQHHFSLFIGFLSLVAITLLLTYYPCFDTKSKQITWHQYIIFVAISIIYAYNFANTFYNYLYPFEQMETLPPAARTMFFKSLQHFLNDPIEIKSYGDSGTKNPKDRKNLIIIEVESFEQQLMGRFNKFFPNSMPFLSNLSNYGVYVERMETQPYTTWSVASLFAAQCNLPLLMTYKRAYNNANFHLLPEHRCIGNYLQPEGYNLISFLCNTFIANFKLHLQLHNWTVYDLKEHGFNRDYDMFKYIGDTVIPKLAEKSSQPFVLHIANADTHPFPRFIVDDRCKIKFRKGTSQLLKSFNCLDLVFKSFLTKVEKSGLLENTELIIYGDHVLMGTFPRQANIIEPRHIAVMLPYHKHRKLITKRTSIYDLAPTFMELTGMKDYSPQFPFGSSIFSNKIGLFPDNRHFRFIYDFFSGQMKWSKDVSCDGKKEGFCRKT